MFKSTGCSSRGPKFKSQHFGGRGSQISESEASLVKSEFQDSRGYTEKPCLEKQKTKTKKQKIKTKQNQTKQQNPADKTNKRHV